MNLEDLEADNLSPGQRRLADFFLRNKDRIPYLGIEEIAVENGTSTATVSRFIKFIGYENMKDLKTALRDTMDISPAAKVRSSLNSLESGDLLEGVTEAEIANLRIAAAGIDREAFSRAATALARAPRVALYGNGASRCLSELLAFRLNRYGKSVRHLGRATSSMAEALFDIGPDDAVVAFAFFKEREELRRVFDFARSRGACSIIVTDLLVSSTASSADCVLATHRGELTRFHSMVAPIALVDSLTLAVAKELMPGSAEALDRLHECKSVLRGEAKK